MSQPIHNTDPGPTVMHDFDCTHDPCRCAPAPQGLRMAVMTPSLDAAISAGHINHMADVIQAYFAEEDPDVARMLFNQDYEELAMRLWPIAEEAVRLAAQNDTEIS
jgi:hypothetical protein